MPFPLSTKLTPEGSPLLTLSVGVGYPEVVTVKVPPVPWMNVAWSAEVTDGASSTVSVKVFTALGVAPLAAVIVRG